MSAFWISLFWSPNHHIIHVNVDWSMQCKERAGKQNKGAILSTGKSSNSSSSSSVVAGFWSFAASPAADLSLVVALAVGAAPEAGAADMVNSLFVCVFLGGFGLE
ncbi:hypothetical protein ACMFMG_009004 [Clarireedia jacksonii]